MDFLSSGIGFGIVLDQMSVTAEETKVLKEESHWLLVRAQAALERTEAVIEKYGFLFRKRKRK